MTRELRKVIMHRSKLRNRYKKNKTIEGLRAYRAQRNKCIKLLREAKINYYNQLDTKNFSDNGKFWKAIKPIFSGNSNYTKTNFLVENDEMITDNAKIADVFIEYFVDISKEIVSGGSSVGRFGQCPPQEK